MTDLKTEQELYSLIDTQFPDNTQGLISAKRLRDFLKTGIGSLLIQRSELVEITTDPYVVTDAEINENRFHYTSGFDRIIQLPDDASAVEGQSFVMLSMDNSLINVQALDPILGDANFTEPVLVQYRSFGGEWIALPLYLSRKDTVKVALTFNEPGNLTAGEEMRIGNTEGQNNEGWVSPLTGSLVKASISRGNTADADIDISINGVVQETINSTSLKSTHDTSIAVNEGDSVMVLGGASTSNPMTQPVVVLILKEEE